MFRLLLLFSFFSLGTAAQTLRPARPNASSGLSLNSDNASIHWKLCPRDGIRGDSTQLLRPGYDTRDWTDAIVPGTTFTSFVAAGKEPDPNYADNIYRVDKKKYDRDFWYRLEFPTPALASAAASGMPIATRTHPAGRHLWLHFRGINRRGEIFFNGTRLGELDGFMQRGDYDITSLITPKGPNVLAVLVHWPGRPIPNYASPTYISSDSWDWMPSVPGLLAGITDEVYLTTTGDVNIIDPWIRTESATEKEARLSLQLHLANHSDAPTKGTLTVNIQPGNITLTRQLTLAPNAIDSESFDPAHDAALVVRNPKRWWPNGYGEPNLYTCRVTFRETGGSTLALAAAAGHASGATASHATRTPAGRLSDSTRFQFGIRQYTYDTLGGVFHLWVNGKRIFVKGGNWGMSEYLLRCRGAEYDYKVLLHHEMHYNMIRNWIGSTTDDAFYAACDKYGIMVWDDFWLNSHPNLPTDLKSFETNVDEKIRRLRNHPSIAVWCGDNESTPLPPLNDSIRASVQTLDHGDRWYQPNSHSGALTGSGPWTNAGALWYFTKYPGGFGGSPGWGFRTEIGTAVFPTFESFKEFMPDSALWPRNELWNKHFFGPGAANAGPDNYVRTIIQNYGSPSGIEDFCRKAQLLNIETNKALYEGWQHHMWDDASGVMTWMSQSAYPSMVWQTYDYYYDLTGAYWGVRKACEPVHIQWGCADNSVKVINTTGKDLHHLEARAIVYNMNGTPVPAYGKAITIDAPADTTTECFRLQLNSGPGGSGNLSPVVFIRLLLDDEKGALVSDNFYWRSDKDNDYTALNTLPPARLETTSRLIRQGSRSVIEATISNPGPTTRDAATGTDTPYSPVAFAIRVQAVRASDGKRILPALQDDNYFTLLPGESKTVHISFDPALLPDGKYKLRVEPYNDATPAPSAPATPLTLASPLQSNMVIQEGKPFTIWGHATPREKVRIDADWLAEPVTVRPAADGFFEAIIPVPKAARGDYREHSLTVVCGAEMLTLSHLLIGELWFCSGQSNMQFSMATVLDSTADIAAAHYPNIRLFNAYLNFSDTPVDEIGGSWVECSPKTVRGFSAVGYYFGRRLQQTLDVPVGLIFSGIGASAAQAYVPRNVLAEDTLLDRRYLEPYLQSPRSHEHIDGRFSFEKVTRPYLLYNAMIYPFRHLSIRGFCWYQGESNRTERESYTDLTQTMIRSWREVFEQGDLPFYYVQVAPFFYDQPDPTLADYAFFREAQEKIAALPNTGKVITMDVGEAKNLHPINKKPVGERLAATALNREYGLTDIVCRGPQYRCLEIKGREAIVHFEPGTISGGLKTNDDKAPAFFTMAGEDQVFYPAQARIDGDEIVVTCDKVKKPVAVRYAFTNFAVTNLENGAGWPVVPFRTDDWAEKQPPAQSK
jgi:hypothetical protein